MMIRHGILTALLAVVFLFTGCSGCSESGGSKNLPDVGSDVWDDVSSGDAASDDVGDVAEDVADVVEDAGDVVEDVGDVIEDAGEDVSDDADVEEEFDDGLDEYFEIVAQVREALRTSPDHLVAHAEQLVLAGEAEAIFAFVRDQIALVPGEEGMANLTTSVRWGARATLRSGMGTMREKADLLVDLFTQAGIEAQVVGPFTGEQVTRQALEDALWRPMERVFGPDTEDAQKSRWLEFLTGGERVVGLNQTSSFDAADAKANQLADALLELLPAPPANQSYVFDPDGGIPVVKVVIDGQERVVNPHFASASFDDSNMPLLSEAPAAEGMLPVEIAVSYASQGEPEHWEELLRREYDADEVVGRQLLLNFVASTDAYDLTMRLGDLRTMLPVLKVQDPRLGEEERLGLMEVGSALTVQGESFAHQTDLEEALIGGYVLSADVDDEAARDVVTFEVEARAEAFPTVELSFRPLDARGRVVPGLSGGSFRLAEDGQRLPATLIQNRPDPLRVLFLLDTSGSIPAEFRDESTAAFVTDVSEVLFDAYPWAEVGVLRVDGANYRNQVTSSTLWSSDLDEVEARALAAISRNGGSALWENLAFASSLEPTVIVFVNDGANIGNDNEEIRDMIAAGPPAIVVGVGPYEADVLTEMAALSGGVFVTARTLEEVEASLMSFLSDADELIYRLRYTAPLEGPPVRTPVLETASRQARGQTTYMVPDDIIVPPAITGLRLHVRVGDREVVRLFAGTEDPELAAHPTPEIVEDVLGALLSATFVSVEADTPMASTWLDDYMAALLTRRSVVGSIRADFDAHFDSLNEAFDMVPAPLFAANPRVERSGQGAQSRTFPTGLRLAVYNQRQLLRENLTQFSIDILPTAGFVTMSRPVEEGEAGNDFATTLRQTARLAVAESGNFDRDGTVGDGHMAGYSTLKLLEDVDLISIPPGAQSLAGYFPELESADVAAWDALVAPYRANWHVVAPLDGAPRAFWAIHAQTGEMYGILPDGTGGGKTLADFMTDIDEAMELMEMSLWLVGVATDNSDLAGGLSGLIDTAGMVGNLNIRLLTIAIMALTWVQSSMHLDQSELRLFATYVCSAIIEVVEGVEDDDLWNQVIFALMFPTPAQMPICNML